MLPGMNVVWIKRDARITDHEPLAAAAMCHLPMLLLYIYDPCQMTSDCYHEAHHTFINDGLRDFDKRVCALAAEGGGGLTVRSGCAANVFAELHARVPIGEIFSHDDVGNKVAAGCCCKVDAWAAASGVKWRKFRQDGVSDVRHEQLDEGSWAKKWSTQMMQPQASTPTRLRLVSTDTIARGRIADAHDCGVKHLGARPGAQHGGETLGCGMLTSFLERRGEGYCDELSSPLSGWDSCSRLSPYLAWGHVSLRHVFQALSKRQQELRDAKARGEDTKRWLKSLAALGSRLRWRSHFSQKLHDQPSIEEENMCQAYDVLRTEVDVSKLDAWVAGKTGFPMVSPRPVCLSSSQPLSPPPRSFCFSFACAYVD